MTVPIRSPELVVGRSMVPGVGLEPTRIATADFESAASTNSATRAGLRNAEARVLVWVVNPKFWSVRKADAFSQKSARVYHISSP